MIILFAAGKKRLDKYAIKGKIHSTSVGKEVKKRP